MGKEKGTEPQREGDRDLEREWLTETQREGTETQLLAEALSCPH